MKLKDIFTALLIVSVFLALIFYFSIPSVNNISPTPIHTDMSHYGNPESNTGCLTNEQSIQLTSSNGQGVVCGTECQWSTDCPPAEDKYLYPRCQFFNNATSFCLLTCTIDADCMEMGNAFCLRASDSSKPSSCLYHEIPSSPSGNSGAGGGSTSDSSTNDVELGLNIFMGVLVLFLIVFVCYQRRKHLRCNCALPYGIWLWGKPKIAQEEHHSEYASWVDNPSDSSDNNDDDNDNETKTEQKSDTDNDRKLCRCDASANTFVEHWGSAGWNCMTCKGFLTDPIRIAHEDKGKKQNEAIDQIAFEARNGQSMEELAAIASHIRGVTVEWLLLFTQTHNCWDWPTWKVNAEIIKPATVVQRCRYVELDHMKSQHIPGKADIFVSHTWGAKWGTLVAAVVDAVPPSARIWCDLFAVRQWPGSSYDLNFRGVIKRVSGVLVASEAVPLDFDLRAVIVEGKLPAEDIRKKMPFFRIWCLVELAAAKTGNLPIVFKCGKAVQQHTTMEGHCSFWENDPSQLRLMEHMVQVELAEASNPVDLKRELDTVRNSPGGIAGLQKIIIGSIIGASSIGSQDHSVPLCLERFILGFEGELYQRCQDTQNLDVAMLRLALVAASGGGHVKAVELLLQTLHLQPMEVAQWPLPIIAAARCGDTRILRMLLQACGPHRQLAVNVERRELHASETYYVCGNSEKNVPCVDRDGDSWKGNPTTPMPVTPLLAATGRGHLEATRLLLETGADPNQGDQTRSWFPLHSSLHGRNTDVTRLLVENGATVNLRTCNGRGYTALMFAAVEKNVESASVLLEAGANPSITRTSLSGTRLVRTVCHLIMGYIMYWLVSSIVNHNPDDIFDFSIIYALFIFLFGMCWLPTLLVEFRRDSALRDAVKNNDEEMVKLLRPKTWVFVCFGVYIS